MTPANLDTLVRANAKALRLSLTEAQFGEIAAQLAILLEHADAFSQIELAHDLEPLPVFEP